MRTINLDSKDLDVEINAPLASGADSLRIRVVEHLRHVRGTWFLDEASGVPYLGDIVNRSAGDFVPRNIITAQVESVDGVSRVSDIEYRFDPTTRNIRYSATVIGDSGTAEIELELEA